VIDDAYALELYMMAVAVVEAKGTIITVGLTTLREYRHGNLIVHYMPSTGHLDIWYRRKVFTVNRRKGALRVEFYAPGEWESELEDAAGKPLPN
jgi:hypothetical protein